MNKPHALLLLPRLRVQNANAISGPFSWGFPAPSAFTGFVHALSRRLPEALGVDVHLDGVGVVCHEFEPQMAGGYVKSFCLTRNPNDENGNPPAFVEEGRTHFEVSLLVGVHGDSLFEFTPEELAAMAQQILGLAQGQRLAGGSILASAPDYRHEPSLSILPTDEDASRSYFRKLKRRLLPGFALVSRDDRLQQRLSELRALVPESTALDALLDLCALHWDCETSTDSNAVVWSIRQRRGWLVPLPVGYAAISPLYDAGTVRNARDPTIPFRFVESVYSLGEWISPHRLDDPSRLLWYHQADAEAGLYGCINDYAVTEAPSLEIQQGVTT
ncbi:type I-F CRISPR-associated protein Csy2 [Hydrocarboniphaga sp.]|uniref:type I-F CRISPR-associated protein Csy2 n=1 Tax=Hydrocarboniphaga sp. TaxID=2033016 RepID=UPI003D10CCFA